MRSFPFVALEGLDGTGKTTLAEVLAEQVRTQGLPAISIHTPTVPYSHISRSIIDECSISARFHFFLSAVIHASEQIRPLLRSAVVICDRYIYSTLAYHRAAGLTIDINPDDLGIVMPDIALLLTVKKDGIRKARITDRGSITEADRKARDDSKLIARIRREYSRFELTPIETGQRTQSETAMVVMEMIQSRYRLAKPP